MLTPGRIIATDYECAEQWDKPNGSAPLQWMAIRGFNRYRPDPLGAEIAWSWLQTVNHVSTQHHKLIVKHPIGTGVPPPACCGVHSL
ncbi:trehalase family glycosidase [Klebsiella variicola]|uniref:trehalase family glycosidase n=1 Tax=Klebsiella variicola TaxID=244366 RepID=UPI003F664B65